MGIVFSGNAEFLASPCSPCSILGGCCGSRVILLSVTSALQTHDDRVQFLVRGLKLYNPLQVGALGILLFTGAFQLTDLKAAYRELFVKQLGYNLGIKLIRRILPRAFQCVSVHGNRAPVREAT